MRSAIPYGIILDDKIIKSFVDSWLISGIMCVSCLTVALNSMLVMVSDRENGMYKDFTTAPVKPYVLTLGYFLSFYFITFIICFAVLIIGIIYLAASSAIYFSAADFFVVLGILMLSVMSSTLIMMFIMSFIKTGSAGGAFSGIFSAVIGFLTGAYMPVSVFPKAIASITVFIPGTSSGGLFRNFLMQGALDEMGKGLPPIFAEEMSKSFSFNHEFFGRTLGCDFMWIYLAGSVAVFLTINIIAGIIRKKRGNK